MMESLKGLRDRHLQRRLRLANPGQGGVQDQKQRLQPGPVPQAYGVEKSPAAL